MNDQNNNQLAVLPRRSRRLATIIPASHWISIGYSQEDGERMERLQNDMKNVEELDVTDIQLEWTHEEHILLHHEMMTPHWNKLFKTLNGRTSVQSFDVRRLFLPVTLLDIMFPALQTVNLTKLVVAQTNMEDGGLLLLSSFLGENTSLRYLLLCETISDLSIATPLSEALKHHPILETMLFVDSGFDNTAVLEKILDGCRGIKEEVSAEAVELGLEGVTAIAHFIRSNYPTERMHLNSNELSDNDAILLLSSLKYNTHLKQLSLANNNITEEGEKAILKTMFDTTSMDSIVKSNHTCAIHTWNIQDNSIIADRSPLERGALSINLKILDDHDRPLSIGQKIRKKIVLALCGVDGELFDLSLLNDIPLHLMPHVLELIQEHSEIRKNDLYWNDDWGDSEIPTEKQLGIDALSRTFHTLRGWELPLLFVNLRTPSANISTGKRKRRKTRRY